jgi:hypothetical protein
VASGGADGEVWRWRCGAARAARARPAPAQAMPSATAEHVATLEALLGSAQEGARALQQVPRLAGRPPAAMRRTFARLVQAEGEHLASHVVSVLAQALVAPMHQLPSW